MAEPNALFFVEPGTNLLAEYEVDVKNNESASGLDLQVKIEETIAKVPARKERPAKKATEQKQEKRINISEGSQTKVRTVNRPGPAPVVRGLRHTSRPSASQAAPSALVGPKAKAPLGTRQASSVLTSIPSSSSAFAPPISTTSKPKSSPKKATKPPSTTNVASADKGKHGKENGTAPPSSTTLPALWDKRFVPCEPKKGTEKEDTKPRKPFSSQTLKPRVQPSPHSESLRGPQLSETVPLLRAHAESLEKKARMSSENGPSVPSSSCSEGFLASHKRKRSLSDVGHHPRISMPYRLEAAKKLSLKRAEYEAEAQKYQAATNTALSQSAARSLKDTLEAAKDQQDEVAIIHILAKMRPVRGAKHFSPGDPIGANLKCLLESLENTAKTIVYSVEIQEMATELLGFMKLAHGDPTRSEMPRREQPRQQSFTVGGTVKHAKPGILGIPPILGTRR